MSLSKEDIQIIINEIRKSNNERAGAKNREGVKAQPTKRAHISNKPTIAAIAKSLAVIGVFAFWGLVFVGLCHYLAPYL